MATYSNTGTDPTARVMMFANCNDNGVSRAAEMAWWAGVYESREDTFRGGKYGSIVSTHGWRGVAKHVSV